jgi:hypothetical protein
MKYVKKEFYYITKDNRYDINSDDLHIRLQIKRLSVHYTKYPYFSRAHIQNLSKMGIRSCGTNFHKEFNSNKRATLVKDENSEGDFKVLKVSINDPGKTGTDNCIDKFLIKNNQDYLNETWESSSFKRVEDDQVLNQRHQILKVTGIYKIMENQQDFLLFVKSKGYPKFRNFDQLLGSLSRGKLIKLVEEYLQLPRSLLRLSVRNQLVKEGA